MRFMRLQFARTTAGLRHPPPALIGKPYHLADLAAQVEEVPAIARLWIQKWSYCLMVVCGAEEDRTPDLCIANAALSQLSYRPMTRRDFSSKRSIAASVPTRNHFAQKGREGGVR